jgi:hypothetical protein
VFDTAPADFHFLYPAAIFYVLAPQIINHLHCFLLANCLRKAVHCLAFRFTFKYQQGRSAHHGSNAVHTSSRELLEGL